MYHDHPYIGLYLRKDENVSLLLLPHKLPPGRKESALIIPINRKNIQIQYEHDPQRDKPMNP